MKKQLFILIVLIISVLRAQATVRTVSNHPSGGAQFSTLGAAYNASSNGDTLILEGTDLTYLSDHALYQSWAKSLVVIGSGFNPGTSTGKKTRIGATWGYTTLNLTSGTSGSRFYGIEFLNEIQMQTSISNTIFEDCKFNGRISCDNMSFTNATFANCVFDYNDYDILYVTSTSVVTAQYYNCIFDSKFSGAGNPSVVYTFDHCIFLKPSGDILQNLISPVVMNSIFMNSSSVANASTTGGVFNNNIARVATVLPPAGCTGTDNMVSTDPMFTTYTNGSTYANTFDFALQAASPGKNAATDATDIGVHGGASTFSETGEPLIIPVIRTMTVTNAAVESGGTINVTVTAGKPNVD